MDLIDGLLTRRSVRKYQDKKIQKDILKDIIRIAQYAPSAHDTRPWEFVIVEDKEALAEFRSLQRASLFAVSSAAVILVCVDMTKTLTRQKEDWNYSDVDASSATMNILLAAHGKGIGACWCGCAPMVKPIEDVSQKFGLPKHIKPCSIVVLGYPQGENRQVPQRYDESKIHWEKW